jgi:hypothetical protein
VLQTDQIRTPPVRTGSEHIAGRTLTMALQILGRAWVDVMIAIGGKRVMLGPWPAAPLGRRNPGRADRRLRSGPRLRRWGCLIGPPVSGPGTLSRVDRGSVLAWFAPLQEAAGDRVSPPSPGDPVQQVLHQPVVSPLDDERGGELLRRIAAEQIERPLALAEKPLDISDSKRRLGGGIRLGACNAGAEPALHASLKPFVRRGVGHRVHPCVTPARKGPGWSRIGAVSGGFMLFRTPRKQSHR